METSFDQHCCWFGRRHRGRDLSFPDERFGEQVLSKLEIDVIGVERTRYWWSFPSQPQQVIGSVLQMVEQRQRMEQQSMSGVHFLPLTAHNTWEEDHCTHSKRRMQTVWRELGSRFFGHKLLLLLFFLFSFPSSFQVDDTESQVKHAKTNGHTREGKETTTMDTTGQKGWQHNCLVKKEGGHFSVSHFFLSTSSTWLLLLPLSPHTKLNVMLLVSGSPNDHLKNWEKWFEREISLFLFLSPSKNVGCREEKEWMKEKMKKKEGTRFLVLFWGKPLNEKWSDGRSRRTADQTTDWQVLHVEKMLETFIITKRVE